jgi:hypothetical protein
VAVLAFENWDRANRVTKCFVNATLPVQLRDEAALYADAYDLWNHLCDRFSAQNLSSMALLASELFSLKLEDFPNTAAFITAVTQRENEIVSSGIEWRTAAVAGVILNGMGNKYPATKELLLMLPPEQQTKETFARRLL